MAEKL
jgi:acyl-CoA oxidase